MRFTSDELMLRLYRLRYDDPVSFAHLAGAKSCWAAVEVLALGHDVALTGTNGAGHGPLGRQVDPGTSATTFYSTI